MEGIGAPEKNRTKTSASMVTSSEEPSSSISVSRSTPVNRMWGSGAPRRRSKSPPGPSSGAVSGWTHSRPPSCVTPSTLPKNSHDIVLVAVESPSSRHECGGLGAGTTWALAIMASAMLSERPSSVCPSNVTGPSTRIWASLIDSAHGVEPSHVPPWMVTAVPSTGWMTSVLPTPAIDSRSEDSSATTRPCRTASAGTSGKKNVRGGSSRVEHQPASSWMARVTAYPVRNGGAKSGSPQACAQTVSGSVSNVVHGEMSPTEVTGSKQSMLAQGMNVNPSSPASKVAVGRSWFQTHSHAYRSPSSGIVCER